MNKRQLVNQLVPNGRKLRGKAISVVQQYAITTYRVDRYQCGPRQVCILQPCLRAMALSIRLHALHALVLSSP